MNPEAKIKLIITDLDDTLLDDNLEITARSRRAIGRAMARGCQVAAASGRMYESIKPYALALGLTTPVIACNGAELVDVKSDARLSRVYLPAPLARDLIAMGEQMGAYMQVYYERCYYFAEDCSYSMRYEASSGVTGEAVGAPLSAYVKRDTPKLLLYEDDTQKVLQWQARFTAAFPEVVNVTTSKPFYLEFTRPDANKGRAARELASMLSIPLSACAAFGDGENDLSMLTSVGYGVAMGNADEAVRTRSRLVAEPNHADGVAKTIESWLDAGLI